MSSPLTGEPAGPSIWHSGTRETYGKHGRSDKWIAQRIPAQETRNRLTDYWAANEVKPDQEFAILTNLIHQEWTGLSIKEHKQLKSLKSQNLHDHISEAELIFTASAKLSTRQIAETASAKGKPANQKAARTGGSIAKRARTGLESRTGRKVVPDENHLPPTSSPKRLNG